MYISANSNIGMATLLQQQNKNIVKTTTTAGVSAIATTNSAVLTNGSSNAVLGSNLILGSPGGGGVVGSGSVLQTQQQQPLLQQQQQQKPQQQQQSMQQLLITDSRVINAPRATDSIVLTNAATGAASILTYQQYQQLLQQQQPQQHVQGINANSSSAIVGTTLNSTTAAAAATSSTTRLLMPHEMVSIPTATETVAAAASASGGAVSGVGAAGDLTMIAGSTPAAVPITMSGAVISTQSAALVGSTPAGAAATMAPLASVVAVTTANNRHLLQQKQLQSSAKIHYANNIINSSNNNGSAANRSIVLKQNRFVLQQQHQQPTAINNLSTNNTSNNNGCGGNVNLINTNATTIRYFAQIGQQQQQQQQSVAITAINGVVSANSNSNINNSANNNNISDAPSTSSNNIIAINRSVSNSSNFVSTTATATTTPAATVVQQRQHRQQLRYSGDALPNNGGSGSAIAFNRLLNTSTSTTTATATTTPSIVPNGNININNNNNSNSHNSKTPAIIQTTTAKIESDADKLVNPSVDQPSDFTKFTSATTSSVTSTSTANTEDGEPEVDIVINNVVCSFSVRCHLSLRDIALNGFNVEYRRENGMVTMKLRRPYTTASIWSSGRITCTGATSELQAKIAARRYARCLCKLGFPVRFQNFRIVNVLGTCSMPWAIKIVNFSERYRENASYEPELHPGVTYKMRDPKATLKIFSTGSITVTAASVADVQAAIEHVYPLVFDFRKKRSPEELQQLRAKQKQIAHADPNELEDIINHTRTEDVNANSSNIFTNTTIGNANECLAAANRISMAFNNAVATDKNIAAAIAAYPAVSIPTAVKQQPTLYIPTSTTSARRRATETWASKQQTKRPCFTGGSFAAATTGGGIAARNRFTTVGHKPPTWRTIGGRVSEASASSSRVGTSSVVINERVAEDADDPDAFEFDPEELIEVDENEL